MKTRKRTLTGALLSAALMLLGAYGARAADTNPLNDSDTLMITITPATDLGVDVDTATTRFSETDTPGTMSLSLALGATAYFVSPATVTILGNFNNQEVQLQAAALNNWTVDTDQVAKANAVQLFALFGSDVGMTAHPSEAEFDSDSGRHQVTGTPQVAGQITTDEAASTIRNSNRYEINDGSMTGWGEMDNLTVGALRQLWLRVDAPPQSSYSGDQRVQVTLTAVSGAAN